MNELKKAIEGVLDGNWRMGDCGGQGDELRLFLGEDANPIEHLREVYDAVKERL